MEFLWSENHLHRKLSWKMRLTFTIFSGFIFINLLITIQNVFSFGNDDEIIRSFGLAEFLVNFQGCLIHLINYGIIYNSPIYIPLVISQAPSQLRNFDAYNDEDMPHYGKTALSRSTNCQAYFYMFPDPVTDRGPGGRELNVPRSVLQPRSLMNYPR